jgi:hypothetical protein
MEYQCFYLNPAMKLGHDDDAVVLFESNCLAKAGSFIYEDWKLNKRDIAVYQPRSQGYREIYRNKARNAKGQYA